MTGIIEICMCKCHMRRNHITAATTSHQIICITLEHIKASSAPDFRSLPIFELK